MVDAKLRAAVYDILPWRKMPESDARSVGRVWWPHGAELTVEHLKMTEAAAEATIRDNQVTFDLSQYSSN